jgi:DNA repair protein RadA/Sms
MRVAKSRWSSCDSAPTGSKKDAGPVHVVGETSLEGVIDASTRVGADILVLDSIQTVYTEQLESAPGNVGQVRECAARLMRFAKESGAAVIVVGHVTKGGGLAGPKTLEHIVDTVLYFEGEASLDYRLLRATKNRFGSVDEIGVFSMTSHGLVPVPNPSALFLDARAAGTSGSAVTALWKARDRCWWKFRPWPRVQGSELPNEWRPAWIRSAWRCCLPCSNGGAGPRSPTSTSSCRRPAGVRLSEPSADLAIAAALLSSVLNRPSPPDVLFLGEIGLGGEVRPIGGLERRLTEAARLGFRRVFTSGRTAGPIPGFSIVGLDHVEQLVRALAA